MIFVKYRWIVAHQRQCLWLGELICVEIEAYTTAYLLSWLMSSVHIQNAYLPTMEEDHLLEARRVLRGQFYGKLIIAMLLWVHTYDIQFCLCLYSLSPWSSILCWRGILSILIIITNLCRLHVLYCVLCDSVVVQWRSWLVTLVVLVLEAWTITWDQTTLQPERKLIYSYIEMCKITYFSLVMILHKPATSSDALRLSVVLLQQWPKDRRHSSTHQASCTWQCLGWVLLEAFRQGHSTSG